MPTREVAVSSGPSSTPGSLPFIPSGMQAPPVDLAQVPIEDTPAWSEALSPEEDLGAIESPEDKRSAPPVPFETEAEASLPFHTDSHQADVVGELLDEAEGAVDVRLDDTNPRIQLPPAVDVYHEDTKPRAIVEGAELLRDEDPEEVSQSGRSRPGGGRVTRRRATSAGSPGLSARSTSSSPKLAAVAAREEALKDAAPAEIVTRRTSLPRRSTSPLKWVGLVLGLLMLGGGAGALIFFVLNRPPEPEVKPPPARPLFPPGARAPKVPAPDSPGVETAPERDSAEAEVKSAADAPAEALAEAPPVAAAAAPVAETTPEVATAPGPEDSEADGLSDDALLAPLKPMPGSTTSSSTKRGGVPPRKRGTARVQSALQKEWTRTKGAFKALTKTYGCEQLEHLCPRYDYLKDQVESAGSGEDGALLSKVKELYRDINLKAKSGS